ncbi:MAG: co-chaperone GroES [Chloroflexi bacterium]|nr:co-chaperone GroES [Chloroflexota bacterium]
MARKFEPLGDRVVIKRIEKDQTTTSGLVIPDTAKEQPQEGEIVAVGPGRVTDEGKKIPLELKVGDKVIFAKYAGSEIKEDGVEYLFLRESDILSKIS